MLALFNRDHRDRRNRRNRHPQVLAAMLALFYIERVLRNNRDALGQYGDHEDVKKMEAETAGLKAWSEKNVTFSRMPRHLQARCHLTPSASKPPLRTHPPRTPPHTSSHMPRHATPHHATPHRTHASRPHQQGCGDVPRAAQTRDRHT